MHAESSRQTNAATAAAETDLLVINGWVMSWKPLRDDQGRRLRCLQIRVCGTTRNVQLVTDRRCAVSQMVVVALEGATLIDGSVVHQLQIADHWSEGVIVDVTTQLFIVRAVLVNGVEAELHLSVRDKFCDLQVAVETALGVPRAEQQLAMGKFFLNPDSHPDLSVLGFLWCSTADHTLTVCRRSITRKSEGCHSTVDPTVTVCRSVGQRYNFGDCHVLENAISFPCELPTPSPQPAGWQCYTTVDSAVPVCRRGSCRIFECRGYEEDLLLRLGHKGDCQLMVHTRSFPCECKWECKSGKRSCHLPSMSPQPAGWAQVLCSTSTPPQTSSCSHPSDTAFQSPDPQPPAPQPQDPQLPVLHLSNPRGYEAQAHWDLLSGRYWHEGALVVLCQWNHHMQRNTFCTAQDDGSPKVSSSGWQLMGATASSKYQRIDLDWTPSSTPSARHWREVSTTKSSRRQRVFNLSASELAAQGLPQHAIDEFLGYDEES